MAKKKPQRKRVIENRQARFRYGTEDSLEVGMILTGEEVKAIRAGQMQIAGSYARVLQGPNHPELWLIGATIAKKEGDKQRSIKLLAHKAQIARLVGLVQQRGYTLVPNRVYFKNNRAKLDLSIAKGLQTHEKRDKIRQRDIDRDIARTLRTK